MAWVTWVIFFIFMSWLFMFGEAKLLIPCRRPPLVYVLMVTVGTGVFVSPVIFLPATVLIVGVQLFYCQRVAALRRAKFLLEVQKARHTQEPRAPQAALRSLPNTRKVRPTPNSAEDG